MKNARIVLHAMPEELLVHVEKWLGAGGFFAAVVGVGFPLAVRQVRTDAEFKSDVAREGVPLRVCLARTPFDLSATTLHEFVVKNASHCVVDVGALSDKGLKESCVTISVEGADDWAFWSQIVKALKAETKAGLWAVSPHTGKRVLSKNSRYTALAARYFEEGGRLLPLAGSAFFIIGDGEGPT